MQWKAKARQKPQLGERKEKLLFAWLPTKVGDLWIWLDSYIGVYEYMEYMYTYDEVVEEGFIYEKYREKIAVAEKWVLIEKKNFNK